VNGGVGSAAGCELAGNGRDVIMVMLVVDIWAAHGHNVCGEIRFAFINEAGLVRSPDPAGISKFSLRNIRHRL
jgi:hypothetical protein